jgi:hypothetical protein
MPSAMPLGPRRCGPRSRQHEACPECDATPPWSLPSHQPLVLYLATRQNGADWVQQRCAFPQTALTSPSLWHAAVTAVVWMAARVQPAAARLGRAGRSTGLHMPGPVRSRQSRQRLSPRLRRCSRTESVDPSHHDPCACRRCVKVNFVFGDRMLGNLPPLVLCARALCEGVAQIVQTRNRRNRS